MAKDRRSSLRSSLLLLAAFGPAPAQTAGGARSQQLMLDFLAKSMPPGSKMSLPASFPSSFADWTDEQKKSGLLTVIQRCSLINALEHDNPNARLVPEPMTKREEAELAVSVCIPAKMPDDWPDRRKYVDDARGLIAKANSYGAALHMPETLKGN